MNIKHLFIVSLIYSTSHLSYSSYTPAISGHRPVLEESQQDYPGYISTFKQWIETGHSSKEGDPEQYKHQATFEKIEDSLDSSPPHTKLEATCFLRDKEDQKVHVASYDISLPHLIQTSSEEQDQKGYHYSEGVLYRPLHQKISYKLPALEGVEGCEQEVSYTKCNYVLPNQELHQAAFNFKVEPEQDTLPNGYYGTRLRQEKPHSYIYSTEQELFLMHSQREAMDLVNHPDIKSQFNLLFTTPHKIVLKPGYTSSDTVSGLLPKGIFIHSDAQQRGVWQPVKEDLSIASEMTYKLTYNNPETHSEDLYFQTIDLDSDTSHAQVLQDLQLSSAAQLIESLDFKGRVFGPEKQALIEVLKAMTQLKALNLSKEDTTQDYNDLIPTLSTLTNLTSLNLTNGLISEENLQKLAALGGLEIIPAPQPTPPTTTTTPTSDSSPQEQSNTATPPTQTTEVIDPNAPPAPPVVAPQAKGEPVVNSNSTPTITTPDPVVKEVTDPSHIPAAQVTTPESSTDINAPAAPINEGQ